EHTHTHTHGHTHTRTRIHTRTRTRIHTHAHTHTNGHAYTHTRTFKVITDEWICLNISFSVERRSLAESLCICRMDDAESCFILSSRNEVDRTAAVRITINTANR